MKFIGNGHVGVWAWKWKLIDNMRLHMKTQTAVVGCCRVGLVWMNVLGKVVGKEWRVETTNGGFCPKNSHPLFEGGLSKRTHTMRGSFD